MPRAGQWALGLVIGVLAGPMVARAEPGQPLPAPDGLLAEGGRAFAPGPGWKLERIENLGNKVVFLFAPTKDAPVQVVLEKRGRAAKALVQTRSFDVYYLGKIDPAVRPDAWALVQRVVKRIEENDDGRFILADAPAPPPAAPPADGPSEPSGWAAERAIHEEMKEILNRGRKAVRKGDAPAVESAARTLVAKSEKLAAGQAGWMLHAAARLWAGIGRDDEARPLFEKALADARGRLARETEARKPPLLQDVRLLEVRALVGLARLDEAKKELAALESAAASPEELCKLVVVAEDLAARGLVDEALSYLQGLADKAPRCPGLYITAGSIAGEARVLDKIGPLLERGARELPDDSGVITQLADLYKFVGRREEATVLMEKTVERGFTDHGVMSQLLGLYARQEAPEKTLERYRARADRDPNDDVAAFFTGALLHYKEQYQASNEYLLRAIRSLPGETRVYIYLAMNAFRTGDQANAEKWIDKAAETATEDPDIYYCRALIKMDKDPRGSLWDIERYLGLTKHAFDEYGPKRKHIAELYEAMKACVDAPHPSKCVEQRKVYEPKGERADAPAWSGGKPRQPEPPRPRWGAWAGAAAAVASLAAGVVIFLRRRSRASTTLVLLAALGAGGAEAATLDPAALLSDSGRAFDPGPGWRLERAELLEDRVAFRFVSDQGAPVLIVLERRGAVERPFARTRSFDLYYVGKLDELAPGAATLVQRVAERLAHNDDGSYELALAPRRPASGMSHAPRPEGSPDLDTPRTLWQQVAFMTPLDRTQVGISAALLLLAVFFFTA